MSCTTFVIHLSKRMQLLDKLVVAQIKNYPTFMYLQGSL